MNTIKGWQWLSVEYSWGFVLRVLLKASLLFLIVNGLWVVFQPMNLLGRISVYGVFVPYRERLPYGESPQANNLSTDNLETMFATHALNRPKAPDEYRVLVIGDSGTWGIQLTNEQTLVGQLNTLNINYNNQRMVFYNVGYPIMSLTKDLMLLQVASDYQADMVIWLNTMESFEPSQQLAPPIVQNNPERVRSLIRTFNLSSDVNDSRFANFTLMDNTLIGQRRMIADWWRLQGYGFAWANTEIDQVYPDYERPTNNFEDEGAQTWYNYTEPTLFTSEDIAFDVISAGHNLLGDIPLVLVNEPIYIADGQNSDLRYNIWYPRWAYDRYRELYTEQASANDWRYIDTWDWIAPAEFTDSPVHLSATGTAELAERLSAEILEILTR
jgi:hypothetical protein